MGCCTSDNKLTMVACGRGASCAGECSAVQASLCPSRNCTGNPEDCSLEPHLEFEEEGDENIERCPTCSGAHLKWCVAQGCPVSTSHECCYHPKCYNQMKEECCWRDYLTGGCHLPFSFALRKSTSMTRPPPKWQNILPRPTFEHSEMQQKFNIVFILAEGNE